MNKQNLNALIIGGTSGLGLEIGRELKNKGVSVFATGRSYQNLPKDICFFRLDITDESARLKESLDILVQQLPHLHILVYAAGFHEAGRLSELNDAHIEKMILVGLTTPALLIQKLLKKQGCLDSLIMLTSTSQWIPREKEPVYTAVKAGSAMLANSLSLDPSIGKVLVVGPAGMNTPFWARTERQDVQSLLSPAWVAQEVLKLWDEKYKYKLARILRDPARVEILNTRDI